MGIRFRCPNGHKLNVKSFLAGKRGVCPDCGQTFRIPPDGTDDSGVVAMPLPSRRNGSARAEEDNLAESDFEAAVAVAAAAVSEPTKAASEGVVFLPPMPATALRGPQMPAPSPVVEAKPRTDTATPEISFPGPVVTKPATALSVPVAPTQPTTTQPAPTQPATQPSTIQPVVPRPAAPQAVSAALLPPTPSSTDPIAEAPDARWYVRPPSGGQYGPARGEILRRWIAEGRVSNDSLVWREGWADWREAGHLFGALLGTPAPAAATAMAADVATALARGPGAPSALPSVVASSSPRSAGERKPVARKRGNDMAVAALVGLVLVCVILVTVLVIVLSQGSG
jgi:hypothetical protein